MSKKKHQQIRLSSSFSTFKSKFDWETVIKTDPNHKRLKIWLMIFIFVIVVVLSANKIYLHFNSKKNQWKPDTMIKTQKYNHNYDKIAFYDIHSHSSDTLDDDQNVRNLVIYGDEDRKSFKSKDDLN